MDEFRAGVTIAILIFILLVIWDQLVAPNLGGGQG